MTESGNAPYPTVDDRCRWTPSTCMDDLCRNSDVGLCGNEDPDDEWGEEYDEELVG